MTSLPHHDPGRAPAPAVSVVAPAHDEAASLRALAREVASALDGVTSWELVVVDDGSEDDSAELLEALAREDPRVRPLHLSPRRGQTAALLTGIAAARGELIATIDADLQNDPADIPHLMAALGEADAAVGIRERRRDPAVRRACSRFANALRRLVTGDRFRDSGCALRVMRAEAAASLPPFDGMHRFVPTLLELRGHAVIERPVAHRERTTGRSKYGVANRAFRAFADLLAVRWMASRIVRLPEPGPQDVLTPVPRPEAAAPRADALVSERPGRRAVR